MEKTSNTEKEILLSLFRSTGIIRSRDVQKHCVSRQTLNRLLKEKSIERVARGLYRVAGSATDARATLAEACQAVYRGVICLLSALRFHDLTTQSPAEVWLAIPIKAHLPRVELPIRFVRFSGAAFSDGIETHTIEGVAVRVYCAAKTVADCFKYRNKIGLDVAIEALRDCLRKGKASQDELWRFAKVCRVANVMRPYMEMAG